MRAEISYSVIDSKKGSQLELVKDTTGNLEYGQLLQFTKNALITISDTVLEEEQDRGFDKKPTLVVDNKFNKSKFDVNPLGKIEYYARTELKETILETYRQILLKSPEKTGRYKSSHVVKFNGSPVAYNYPQLERWVNTQGTFEAKDLIQFINFQPYARKLETLGVTRQRTKPRQKIRKRKKGGRRKVTLPNGSYHLAYMNVKRRFGKNAFIAMDLLPGNRVGIEGPFELTRFHGGKAREKGYYGQNYIYPVITIRAIEAGSTDVTPRLLQ
jgi:hypothetical protein